MGRQKKPTGQDLIRLDAIAQHLKVKSRFPSRDFTAEVTDACLARIAPVVDKLLPCSGEEVALGLGKHLCVTFEEVRGPHDVSRLESHYLKGKREIGFAQMRGELEQPGVDALLFQRMHAEERDPDRWVAVLNLQASAAKAYWNRFHELSHRIAEPPQKILPFRRHQFEASNPVEALMDTVAAEFAYYGPAFRPLVLQAVKKSRLNFRLVDVLQASYAPTASLLATMNAIVNYWPQPAVVLVAEYRGRVGAPNVDQALRVSTQAFSATAGDAGLAFFPNMRAPVGSPIEECFRTGIGQDEAERLGDWVASTGGRLKPLNVHTSARRIGKRVYAVMSVP